jgi:hypothetical protein
MSKKSKIDNKSKSKSRKNVDSSDEDLFDSRVSTRAEKPKAPPVKVPTEAEMAADILQNVEGAKEFTKEVIVLAKERFGKKATEGIYATYVLNGFFKRKCMGGAAKSGTDCKTPTIYGLDFCTKHKNSAKATKSAGLQGVKTAFSARKKETKIALPFNNDEGISIHAEHRFLFRGEGKDTVVVGLYDDETGEIRDLTRDEKKTAARCGYEIEEYDDSIEKVKPISLPTTNSSKSKGYGKFGVTSSSLVSGPKKKFGSFASASKNDSESSSDSDSGNKKKGKKTTVTKKAPPPESSSDSEEESKATAAKKKKTAVSKKAPPPSESSSDSEEESKATAAKKKKSVATKKDSSSSDSSDSGKKAPVTKKTAVVAKKTPPPQSSSDSEEENKTTAAKKKKSVTAKKDSSDSSEEESKTTAAKKKAPATKKDSSSSDSSDSDKKAPVTKKTFGGKGAVVAKKTPPPQSSSDSSDSDKKAPVTKKTAVVAKKTPPPQSSSDSSDSDKKAPVTKKTAAKKTPTKKTPPSDTEDEIIPTAASDSEKEEVSSSKKATKAVMPPLPENESSGSD